MPWCPKCETEYREGITVCADCGSDLVDDLSAKYPLTPTMEETQIVESMEEIFQDMNEEEASAFEVKVVDASGNPVEGVMLQICKDSCIPAKTDANGIAKFNIEITDGHKLQVLSCPAGYQYTGEAEVYLEAGSSEYTVELSEAA